MHSPNVQSDPKKEEATRLAYRFRQASQIIALLVATLGVVVLCGWAFNVSALTYIRPAFQSMKVNTALSFLLLGTGLWLAHDDNRQRSRRILGLVVVAIAGATLAEYAFHISLGIDQLLFRDTRTPSLSAYPGRMASATALCFLFLGLAATCLGTKKAIALQHALVTACFALSLVALCGYLYGAESLYSITSLSRMAVHTAAGLLAACLAYFLACPDEGIVSIAASNSNSGFLLRALVPAIIVVPILIGWLRLEGQRANLYDTPFGIALQVLGSVGCLTALTLLIIRSVHRLEYEQSRTQEAARESEQRFRLVADTAPVLIWMSGTDKLRTYFNKPWLDFTGRSMEQELGNGWAEGVHSDDLRRCLDTYQQSFEQREKFKMEYRLRHYDGEYLWILDIGVPRFNQDRSFAGYIGIAIDVTERKLAENALRASEERLRLAAQAGRMYSFDWDVTTDAVLRSSEHVDILGLTQPLRFTHTQFMEKMYPDDRATLIATIAGLTPENPTAEITYRMKSSQGTLVWLKGSGRAFFNAEGKLLRVIGMVSDITDLKQAEEAVSAMTRKLIEAQEQERARIGRELHDDINQRLAMLSVEVEQLRDNPSEIELRVGEFRKRIEEISNDVQALSHDLHSSKLEYLGVVAGIKSWCKEFAERQKMNVDFRSDVQSVLPLDVGRPIFRVLQEALHNAAKHSGVKRIEVELHEEAGEIHLTIRDLGKGFDLEAARQGRGLGLMSMQERVRLVNGTISIESKPMGGTTIHVRVPLGSDQGQRAAG